MQISSAQQLNNATEKHCSAVELVATKRAQVTARWNDATHAGFTGQFPRALPSRATNVQDDESARAADEARDADTRRVDVTAADEWIAELNQEVDAARISEAAQQKVPCPAVSEAYSPELSRNIAAVTLIFVYSCYQPTQKK